MADARLRLPQELAELTKSEWETVLNEACFSQLDAEIVRLYIMGGLAQVDTATELGRVRMTICRRLRNNIYPRAQDVARKLDLL